MAESEGGGQRGASPLGLALGMGIIYVVWGSTYLAIRVAVESIKPFLMASSRFLIAGVILFLWAKLRGAKFPALVHWRMAVISGGLMLVGGNGLVVWAQEQRMPSNVTALLITTTPLWMALFDWLRPGGARPPRAIWLGSIAGLVGMIIMVIWAKDIDGNTIKPLGVAALVAASISWALGSVFTKYSPRPDSVVMSSALQMLTGGAMLMIMSLATGEAATFRFADVTRQSFLGYLYLVIAGSLVALTAYAWLLQVTEPNLIATYAFVNPVIAVILGWLIMGEKLTGPTLVGGAIIVAAVAWLIAIQWRYAVRRIPMPRRRPTRSLEEVAS